jgi:membrane protease YdiL (CAAX protease family)
VTRIYPVNTDRKFTMYQSLRPAIVGTLIAIAVTTTMDATGYSMFSALPLLPLAGLFWYLQKFSRREVGLTIATAEPYVVAIAYPVLALGLITGIAFTAGATITTETDWNKTLTNIALMSSTGVLMGILTEEGFFRGWLWASLKKGGLSDKQVLVWTTVAFVVWHLSAISLDTGFDLPAREIPIYLVNATLLGLIWGTLRMASGSIVVTSVCHAFWNGIDYPLFGFGEKVGALGIQQTHLYGPEVGLLGIVVNAIALAIIWRWAVSRQAN